MGSQGMEGSCSRKSGVNTSNDWGGKANGPNLFVAKFCSPFYPFGADVFHAEGTRDLEGFLGSFDECLAAKTVLNLHSCQWKLGDGTGHLPIPSNFWLQKYFRGHAPEKEKPISSFLMNLRA
jgi:hypothetical protein